MRPHVRSFALGLLVPLVLPASAGAVATFPAWRDLTGDVQDPGVVVQGTSAGAGTPLHVVWSTADALLERDVAADGALGATRTLLSGIGGLTNPSIARNPVDGSVWVFDAATSSFDGRLFALSTTDGFATTSTPTAISTSTAAATADSSTALFTRTGAAFQAFGSVVHRGVGSDPAEHAITTRCCETWSQLAIDARGGAPLLGWSSTTAHRTGIEVASLATGRVRYAPRSATPTRTATRNRDIPTSITGRVGAPGVYAAYCEGYPRCARGLVWRYGARAPFVVITGKGLTNLRVVAAPRGRLWVMWYHGGLVWARRSNPSVTQFGGIVGAAVPGNIHSTLRRISGNASRGSLDAFATLRGVDGDERTWTTQLLPGLSITTRGTPRVGSTVRVRVEDAGTPLRGATATLRGVSSRTDRHGYAQVRLTRPGTATIRITMPGYTADSVRLPVRR
jgi:hypothetical protein